MNNSKQFFSTTSGIAGVLLVSMVMVNILTAGGDKFSPKTVGMGRAFVAASRGLDAVGMNPANLALDDRNATVTFNFAPIGFSVGSDLFNYKIYNDFFTGVPVIGADGKETRVGKELNEQDKKDILALFPSGIARTQLGVETSPIGLSMQIGDFGFAIVPSVQTVMNLDIPEGYMKFFLNGLDPTGSVYDLNGTAINASSVGEVNFSAAYKIPFSTSDIDEVAVGFGVKYLVGLGYIITEKYNSSISNSPLRTTPDDKGNLTDLNANFDFLQFTARMDPNSPEPVGSGLGFDFGVTGFLYNTVRVGVSVTDIGSIKWDKRTKAVIGSANMTIYSIADKEAQDSLKKAFKGKTIDTTGFEFDLPTALHVGMAVQMDDVIDDLPFRWLIAADLHLGFNEVAGNTKLAQYSIGMELDPLAGWLPLRTGIMVGGRERFAWSMGFGIHIANTFDLDFATQSIAIITTPESFRNGSVTMGMRLRL
ncbi:MAG: DUF5723 family protein [Bacteriovoracaceae bacterium]|nr:DUF5723 family protein [Bacteroidota bacterium]